MMVIYGEKRYVKVVKAAEMLGVHPDTLRRWDNIGWFKAMRTPGGTRIYSVRVLKKFIEGG